MTPQELASYLVTIRTVIAGDFVPELTSPQVKAEAASIVMILNKLITTLRTGDEVAATRLPTWDLLRTELRSLGYTAQRGVAPETGGIPTLYQSLEERIGDIQMTLGRGEAFELFAKKLAAHDPATEQWYARAVAAAVDLAEAGEPQIATAQKKEQAASPADETDKLRQALGAYLKRRFPALPADPITRFRLAPGGHVKQTGIFTLAANDQLPVNLVLRRDLSNSITGTSVADEYPVMQRAYEIGLPVARPILLEADAAVLDGRFMIMTEIVDSVGAGTYFPEERRYQPRTVGPDFGREVADVLARLHSRTRVKPTGAGNDQDALVRSTMETWRKLPQQPFALPAELAFAWLISHPLPADRPRCLIHGDVGSHNIMVRDGRLAALLDWELAHEDDPAIDLAQCRMMLLPDVMPWEEFARHYVAAGGDPVACEGSAVAYFCVWTYIKHGVMNATVRNMYLRGDRDDPIAASIAGHYYHRLQQYEARALQIAVDESRAR